jgi:hypothetical protein
LHVVQEQRRHETIGITKLYTGPVPLAEMARWMTGSPGRPAPAAVPTAEEKAAG